MTVAGAAGSLSGLTDPALDHTGDAANGVAGVVISNIDVKAASRCLGLQGTHPRT